eukprot:166747-Rhodomonas_salina.1
MKEPTSLGHVTSPMHTSLAMVFRSQSASPSHVCTTHPPTLHQHTPDSPPSCPSILIDTITQPVCTRAGQHTCAL